jgi:predicted nucleotidyltransferase
VFTADEPETLADLARALGSDPASVQREVTRLEGAGILRTWRVGRSRLVAPDPDSPIRDELRALLTKAFGPPALLEHALERVPGVERAYIFGSWARRFHGTPGPLPRDIDVLVVGDPDPRAVYDAARGVEERLRIEVNPIVISEDEWTLREGLPARVRDGALVELDVAGAHDR